MTAPTSRPKPVGHPLLATDLRARVRGSWGPALLTGWALVLAATTSAVLLHLVGTDEPMKPGPIPADELGRTLGQWWVLTTTVGLSLLGAATAAPGLAGRREQHTFTTWDTSLLRPRHLVLGPAAGMVAFVTLGAIVALPVGVLAWRLGGAPLALLAAGLGGAWAAGLLAGCIALAASACVASTRRAVVTTAVVLGLLFVGTAVLHAVVHDRRGTAGTDAVLLANPVVAVADAAGATQGAAAEPPTADASDAPLEHLQQTVRRGSTHAGPLSPWLLSAASAGALALLSLVGATWRVGRDRRG